MLSFEKVEPLHKGKHPCIYTEKNEQLYKYRHEKLTKKKGVILHFKCCDCYVRNEK
jgi:hypothetical protein